MKLLLILTMFAFSHHAQASELLKSALQDFQKGAYSQALKTLESASANEKKKLENLYWVGMCQFKLQKFEEASKTLSRVVLNNSNRFEDAAYVWGQSLYASQEFRKAKTAFEKSLARKYKTGGSLYYIGYIENVLDENDKALETFKKILALPKSDEEMKQPALFQIAEIYYEKAQKIKKQTDQNLKLKNEVIPAYEAVISFKSDTPVSAQASGRLAELQQKLGAQVPTTASGAPIPKNPWVIRITQDVKYDTNIVNQADNKIQQVSYVGSAYEKTGLFGKYEYLYKNWIALTPEFSTDLSLYARRMVSSVFANDNANFNPAVRARLDHKIADRPAAGLVEYEFAYGLRDYQSLHELMYYTRSSNFIFGERVDYFKFGSTTLKANIKFSENENRLQNFIGPSFNIGQNVMTFKRYVLNGSFTYEKQNAKNQFYDQATYRISTSYSMPSLVWSTNVDLSMILLITDTINQQPSRGTEKNLNPSITLTKTIDRQSRWQVNVNYGFTRNFSRDANTYAYSKHVFGVGGQYTF